MAIDQTTIALDSATRQVEIVNSFIRAIHDLEEEVKLKNLANLNFNNFDGNFAQHDELSHIDGSYLNKLADVVDALRPWLQSQNWGGNKTYEEQLYEIAGKV